MSLAIGLLLLGFAKRVSGYSNPIEEPKSVVPQPEVPIARHVASVSAATSPITLEGDWPKPTPKPEIAKESPKPVIQQVTIDPNKQYVRRTGTISFNGYSLNCDANPNAVGCCVEVMKDAGLLPQGKVTGNGTAGTIAVEPLKLKEGESTVVVTREGAVGHTLAIRQDKDCKRIIKEGGAGRDRTGECLNEKVIKGKAKLAAVKPAANKAKESAEASKDDSDQVAKPDVVKDTPEPTVVTEADIIGDTGE